MNKSVLAELQQEIDSFKKLGDLRLLPLAEYLCLYLGTENVGEMFRGPLFENIETTKRISEKIYEARGYKVVDEYWRLAGNENDVTLMKKMAYSLNEDYIGTAKEAHGYWKKCGITLFEKADQKHSVCSIGLNPAQEKWYGWSHRAIVGFGVGDRIFEEKYGDDNTLFTQHGKQEIKNLEDAKKAAMAFAAYVS